MKGMGNGSKSLKCADLASEPAEYAPIDDTYNPGIYRVTHAVKLRAVHPDKPIPETAARLLRYASPPEDLIERVQSRLDSLVETAEVKKGECHDNSDLIKTDINSAAKSEG